MYTRIVDTLGATHIYTCQLWVVSYVLINVYDLQLLHNKNIDDFNIYICVVNNMRYICLKTNSSEKEDKFLNKWIYKKTK